MVIVCRLLTLGSVLGLIVLWDPAPGSAALIQGSIDPALFGNLDQSDTDCPSVNCGPTAATNSFSYLQRAFPKIYGERLIPDTNNNDVQDFTELRDVANVLGNDAYMGNCECTPPTGTIIEDFILGKFDYLEDVAPGRTLVKAVMNFAWRLGTANEPADTNHAGAEKPAFVRDGKIPTAAFIARELNAREDVEVFVADNGNGHYLTVTGIEFDTDTQTGQLDVIDPDTGGPVQIDIVGLDDGFIELDYQLVVNGANTLIAHAVSESAIPAPAALALLVIGALVVAAKGRGRRGV